MNDEPLVPFKLYPGWFILAACFVSAMLVIGGTIYSYQLFVIPVTAELGISRGSASIAFIALLIGIAIWSPIVGRLYDIVSVRWLMPLGGAACRRLCDFVTVILPLNHASCNSGFSGACYDIGGRTCGKHNHDAVV